MKSRQKELLLNIEELNGMRAAILTENEQLKEALKGNAGYVIEKNNNEIQSLNKRIRSLEESIEEAYAKAQTSIFDRIFD